MKKTVRILAVFMIIAMLSVSLVSCGKTLTGKYSLEVSGVKTTYEFGLFGTVKRIDYIPATIITSEKTTVTKGKYEIFEDEDNPDNLKIAFEFEGEDRVVYSFIDGEEGGVKYIKIGIFKYTYEK